MTTLDRLLAELPQQAMPPVEQWHPAQRGSIDIHIAADGTWFHEGEPIKRKALVMLFASILRRDDEGYWLVTPVEMQRITVDDAPLFVNRLHAVGDGKVQQLVFSTLTEDRVIVDREHPLWVNDPDVHPAPYVHVREGLHARIGRNVFYQLVELAETTKEKGIETTGVWSGGCFFPLAPKRESFGG